MPPATDYDSPWKDALAAYFRDFMTLLWPSIATLIDWSKPHVFLDKELQRRVRDGDAGRSYVDKLVEVTTYRYGMRRVLIHIEIQGRADARFPARMYRYNALLKDTRGGPVVDSLAVLTGHDAGPEWMRYRDEGLACITEFTFPVVALGHWRTRLPDLVALAATNPFAVIVMAQLQALHDHDAEHRLDGKIRLLRLLYRSGYARDDIRALIRLIDWMITLPPVLEDRFQQAGLAIEEEMKMPFVTTFERLGEARGLAKGLEQGRELGLELGRELERDAIRRNQAAILHRLLTRRFGALPPGFNARLSTAPLDTLNRWLDNAIDAPALDAVFTVASADALLTVASADAEFTVAPADGVLTVLADTLSTPPAAPQSTQA
ncbi:hypothetical protein [Pigmentiphaga litoralis]|uniref:DUF4351 domain-containing protein n=1 Tax=Pigmentiphaga litoralis TaxID=516702 RepID=A0A7Y9IY35_9BURK|nr:hypothetical protein [Pigmentiphaga litoralis]NYE26023.1 hypothetical protein [Pigmentiphaga litoralis]NYE85143.1 hypothetical protein [Pigmentiphaga litoralis]